MILGIAIVLFALREIFQDLFHPSKRGALSDWLGAGLFKAFRKHSSLLPSAGPLAVVVVIFTWAMLLVTGFAFIYWSVFPGAYQFQTASQPAQSEGFWLCFYYSLEMLTTLGLGDIRPNPDWLRMVSGFHTLIGFSMVTASITWIVLLYPALSRARTLARKTATLVEAEKTTGVRVVSRGMHVVLAGLAEEVIRTRVDLVHFPILFYFYTEDRRASVPHALFPLMDFAARGMQPECDELVRLASAALHEALEDLADKIAGRIGIEDHKAETVFRSFAELHT